MQIISRYLFLILRIGLGAMMIYGSTQKFSKPFPTPIEVVEKASKFSEPEQESILKIVLYINSLKQTGYFWELLGICELIFGVFLIVPRTRLISALFLLPITLNIFLFHVF